MSLKNPRISYPDCFQEGLWEEQRTLVSSVSRHLLQNSFFRANLLSLNWDFSFAKCLPSQNNWINPLLRGVHHFVGLIFWRSTTHSGCESTLAPLCVRGSAGKNLFFWEWYGWVVQLSCTIAATLFFPKQHQVCGPCAPRLSHVQAAKPPQLVYPWAWSPKWLPVEKEILGKMASRGGYIHMAFAACFQWSHFGFFSWPAAVEKDQGKAVAGNIVTTRPIYLALVALRKKGLQGLSCWAD